MSNDTATSAQQDDPRRASLVRRFEWHPIKIDDAYTENRFKELELTETLGDYLSIISLMAGVAALITRYRILAWISLFACISTLTNQRNSKENNLQQVSAGIMFSLMTLLMSYFGLRPPGSD